VKPLYPFGFWSELYHVAYTNIKTSDASLSRDGSIAVNIDVENTGKRAGDEVVQLYVKHINSQVSRPDEELKGFKRVHLKAGERTDRDNSPGRSTSGLLGHQQKRLASGARQCLKYV